MRGRSSHSLEGRRLDNLADIKRQLTAEVTALKGLVAAGLKSL